MIERLMAWWDCQRWARVLPSRFVKFGIVGLSNTLISLSVYYLLIAFGVSPLLANTVAFIVSAFNGYIWNAKWVFADRKGDQYAIVRFYAAYLLTFLVGQGLLALQIDLLHVSKWIAPVPSLLVTVPINYVINKLWTFKGPVK